MTLRLILRNSVPASASPYRLLDQQGRELAWANNFLDAQRLRQLSLRSLRAYGYDLLHLARWLHQTRRSLATINQSCLLDYVRRQLDHEPKPTPSTINHRLGVLRCLYRFHYGREIPGGKPHFQRTYTTRSTLGYGRPQRRVARGLRLRQPHRVVVPLSADEVARFWKSFRTFRDLAIVALMLLDGLRSCEVLDLQLEDLCLADAHLRVQGKGNKERALPLPAETLEVLQNYLRLERPLTNSSSLFVSLKGHQRGRPMTAAGLRSLFRHHRRCSKVPQANPHRFRHTFGADMVRAGISLPALMHLMGHTQIHTTMLYVELAPQDIRMTLCYVQVTQQDLQREFHRARLSTAPLHSLPQLPLPPTTAPVQADIAAIHHAIAATRHLLQLFRRQLQDDQSRRKLRRLSQRLLTLRHELDHLASTEK